MRKEFTKEEVEKLRANEGVLKCTSKSVTFTQEFKAMSMERYDEGWTPIQIFQEAGLDINLIGRKVPKWCIGRWKRQLKTKGGLKDNRGKHAGGGGGRKKKESIPKDEKERMKYMEAKIAYLEAENAFLAELRAKERAEK